MLLPAKPEMHGLTQVREEPGGSIRGNNILIREYALSSIWSVENYPNIIELYVSTSKKGH